MENIIFTPEARLTCVRRMERRVSSENKSFRLNQEQSVLPKNKKCERLLRAGSPVEPPSLLSEVLRLLQHDDLHNNTKPHRQHELNAVLNLKWRRETRVNACYSSTSPCVRREWCGADQDGVMRSRGHDTRSNTTVQQWTAFHVWERVRRLSRSRYLQQV